MPYRNFLIFLLAKYVKTSYVFSFFFLLHVGVAGWVPGKEILRRGLRDDSAAMSWFQHVQEEGEVEAGPSRRRSQAALEAKDSLADSTGMPEVGWPFPVAFS